MSMTWNRSAMRGAYSGAASSLSSNFARLSVAVSPRKAFASGDVGMRPAKSRYVRRTNSASSAGALSGTPSAVAFASISASMRAWSGSAARVGAPT